MGGSYKQCNECGKRALSIATRCPGCGRELRGQAVPAGRPAVKLGRFRSPRVVAGVLAVAAVATVVRLGLTSRSAVAASAVANTTAVTTSLDTASAAAVPAEGAGELLVARTWTNVRKARSKHADLEAVLMPGDTVLADSLGQGWYRVALYGEVLGYAHRSTLVER